MTNPDPAPSTAFDLSSTYVHLGLGVRAVPLPDFEFTPDCLADYDERFAADGDEGRLVCIVDQPATWSSWERHPAGEEVVVVLSGKLDLIQEIDGVERRIPMTAGHAVVNPTGVWHTADVHEPGQGLFITPGHGTEHKPR